jgi:hypothetical protein
LFYRNDGQLLAVRIDEIASSLTVGAPTRVFADPYRRDNGSAGGGVPTMTSHRMVGISWWWRNLDPRAAARPRRSGSRSSSTGKKS